MRQAGVTQPVSLPAVALPPATLAQLGDAAEGLLVAATFRPAGTGGEANEEFERDMGSFEPAARPNVFSRQGWLAGRTLARVIESDRGPDDATRVIDAETVLARMGSLDALPMGAMTPPFTTTANLPPPYSRLFTRQVLYGRVAGGAVQLLGEQWHPVSVD